MSDYTTWNSITIDGAPAGLADQLLDLELYEGSYDGNGWVEDDENPHCYVTDGWSSWLRGDIAEWAKAFTVEHPDATISWFEEWRVDDVGYGTDVYRGGELIKEESTQSREVPMLLPEMVIAGKAALARFNDPDDLAEMEIQAQLVEALTALVKGLS